MNYPYLFGYLEAAVVGALPDMATAINRLEQANDNHAVIALGVLRIAHDRLEAAIALVEGDHSG
jgi:hypothetical protein